MYFSHDEPHATEEGKLNKIKNQLHKQRWFQDNFLTNHSYYGMEEKKSWIAEAEVLLFSKKQQANITIMAK